MSRIARNTLIIISLSILMISLSAIYLQPIPPKDQISAARQGITLAKQYGANRFQKSDFEKAELYYDSAMQSWSVINEKFFLFRDYAKTRYYANQAIQWANTSTQGLSEIQSKHFTDIKELLASTKAHIDRFNSIYSKLPMDKNDAKRLASASMLYKEGIVAIDHENWETGKEKLATAREIIQGLIDVYHKRLSEYFQDFAWWIKHRDTAMKASKLSKSNLILIDKYARTCYLYKGNQKVDSFEVELGANWMGDKQFAGDKTTPEGTYKIVKKKSNGNTGYYKALLLNYPNTEDEERFQKNKANGTIPNNASIGSLIEIHGYGGKGHDWTDGCIALKNDDMDKLFERCEVGTPIVIIGSQLPLEKILQ